MSSLNERPVVLVVLVVVLAGALVFAWTRYRAMTGVTKENSIKMTEQELINSMRRD
ncbi:MAG: hypothetical protein GX446_02915 [Chthonomonadales bacterium]|nr:hypothetical protein [Chthonomonadales bacterium]